MPRQAIGLRRFTGFMYVPLATAGFCACNFTLLFLRWVISVIAVAALPNIIY